MKKQLVLIIGIMLIGTATAAAAPSLNGSTGLINNPSADVLQEGDFALGYYHLKHGGEGVMDLGIANQLEMGVAGFRYDGRDNQTLVNAKYSVMPETILTPGISFGVEDIGDVSQRSLYAVASKTLPFGFRIHAGTGNGRFNGVFGGIEKTINPMSVLTGNNAFPATTLIAEYDGKAMNYGARMAIIPGLKIDAGLRDHEAYYGISFTR